MRRQVIHIIQLANSMDDPYIAVTAARNERITTFKKSPDRRSAGDSSMGFLVGLVSVSTANGPSSLPIAGTVD